MPLGEVRVKTFRITFSLPEARTRLKEICESLNAKAVKVLVPPSWFISSLAHDVSIQPRPGARECMGGIWERAAGQGVFIEGFYLDVPYIPKKDGVVRAVVFQDVEGMCVAIYKGFSVRYMRNINTPSSESELMQAVEVAQAVYGARFAQEKAGEVLVDNENLGFELSGGRGGRLIIVSRLSRRAWREITPDIEASRIRRCKSFSCAASMLAVFCLLFFLFILKGCSNLGAVKNHLDRLRRHNLSLKTGFGAAEIEAVNSAWEIFGQAKKLTKTPLEVLCALQQSMPDGVCVERVSCSLNEVMVQGSAREAFSLPVMRGLLADKGLFSDVNIEAEGEGNTTFTIRMAVKR